MLVQGAEESAEDFAGNFGRLPDVIVAVVDDFGFDDGDEAGLLASFSISREDLTVLIYGVVGGGEDVAILIDAEFKGSAPFGETEAHLIVFGKAGIEIVEAFGDGFERIGIKRS